MALAVVEKYRSIQSDNLVFEDTDDTANAAQGRGRHACAVSDTSSVISEFLLQYKPVVTFSQPRARRIF
ncbi:MAG: hypothetical protein R2860_10230 [Desulfobacterales bacterium]